MFGGEEDGELHDTRIDHHQKPRWPSSGFHVCAKMGPITTKSLLMLFEIHLCRVAFASDGNYLGLKLDRKQHRTSSALSSILIPMSFEALLFLYFLSVGNISTKKKILNMM